MIPVDKIKELIAQGENQQTEFKKCSDQISASVYETICSFANREGGYIFIGVDDEGQFIGVNPACADNMVKSIINTLNNPQQFEPTMPLTPELVKVDNKVLICLYIPESEQVHRYKNRFYDRWGDADNDVSKSTYLVRNMFMRKDRESSENEVYPHVSLKNMDEATFDIMRKHIAIKNSSHPWLSMSNQEILDKYFRGLERETNREGYKLAAILLFGKEETILNYCPWHRTDAIFRNMSYKRFLNPRPTDPDIRYDDRDMVCVNLIQSYLRLMRFVERNMPDRFRLANNGIDRLDVRMMLMREIIANTLLHREYVSSYSSKFLIFKDRVITENWTKPFQTGKIDITDWRTHTKNPLLTKVFREMNWAEELGSGQKKIRKYAPLYYEDTKIDIQSGEEFIFSVTYRDPKDFEFEEGNNDFTQVTDKSPISHRQVTDKSALSCRQVADKLSIDELIMIRILKYGIPNAKTAGEIITVAGFRDRDTFMKRYIKPLINESLLAMSIPDKPKSRLQKYYTTEKGKALCQEENVRLME